jgi:hypothetical protein
MGTRLWEVVCDEHGNGCSCEYCGDNDAYFGRINVFYHETAVESMRRGRRVVTAIYSNSPRVYSREVLERQVRRGKPHEP